MVWIHDVTEYAVSRYADGIMNPTGPEKLLALGRRIGLRPEHHVVDIGAGQCGPAILLARQFGCRVTAVEPHEPFLQRGREAVEQAGLSDRFQFVQAQGADADLRPGAYDAALCLGVTWAWGGLVGSLQALRPTVREGGHVAAGEPYRWSEDDDVRYEAHGLTLPQILQAFEDARLPVVGLWRSSTDEWDDYHALHAVSMLEWLDDHPGHPDTEQVRTWRSEHVLSIANHEIGWAIVAGRRWDAAR